jgi:hypothetical protein
MSKEEQRSGDGLRGAQNPVLRVNEPKQTGALSAAKIQ